jgi:predicted transcriptional regulator
MSKIYQPVVRKKTEEIIEILKESGFFDDYEINSDFAHKYFCDKLTDLLIIGEINIEEDELFSEDEFERCLTEIVAGSTLYMLKTKGLINSYEDDDTPETFFLTEEGKKVLKNLKSDDLI